MHDLTFFMGRLQLRLWAFIYFIRSTLYINFNFCVTKIRDSGIIQELYNTISSLVPYGGEYLGEILKTIIKFYNLKIYFCLHCGSETIEHIVSTQTSGINELIIGRFNTFWEMLDDLDNHIQYIEQNENGIIFEVSVQRYIKKVIKSFHTLVCFSLLQAVLFWTLFMNVSIIMV